jgi:hypothetical protein
VRRLKLSGGHGWFRATATALTTTMVTVAVVVAASASPAMAGDKSTEPSDPPDAVMLAEQPLVAAAQAIAALDKERTGLGGIRLQVRKSAVEVWWKGEVPDSVLAEIAAQEKAGVHIILGKAQYSEGELAAAQDQILQNLDAYPGLAFIAAQPDGSGLHGEFTDVDAARDFRFPVSVQVTASAGNTFASRAVDSTPWWGGAVTLTGKSLCTTGFPMGNFFGPFELNRGLITASHCDPAFSGSTFFNGAGSPIGVGVTRTAPVDTTYLVAPSSPRVYTGGPGSASKAVAGPIPNFPGQFVCTSGAVTFEHCTVINLFVFGGAVLPDPRSGGSIVVTGVTLAINTTGGIAVGSGDSGGPVYVPLSPIHVLAAGMIDFSVGGGPCPAGPPGAVCSSMVGYVDINWIMATTLLQLLTA